MDTVKINLLSTCTSLESEAPLKARDYGQRACMPMQCMRIILKDFRGSKNKGIMAAIETLHASKIGFNSVR
jgi:hypothetical protein